MTGRVMQGTEGIFKRLHRTRTGHPASLTEERASTERIEAPEQPQARDQRGGRLQVDVHALLTHCVLELASQPGSLTTCPGQSTVRGAAAPSASYSAPRPAHTHNFC
jgi:hypothetical protein